MPPVGDEDTPAEPDDVAAPDDVAEPDDVVDPREPAVAESGSEVTFTSPQPDRSAVIAAAVIAAAVIRAIRLERLDAPELFDVVCIALSPQGLSPFMVPWQSGNHELNPFPSQGETRSMRRHSCTCPSRQLRHDRARTRPLRSQKRHNVVAPCKTPRVLHSSTNLPPRCPFIFRLRAHIRSDCRQSARLVRIL